MTISMTLKQNSVFYDFCAHKTKFQNFGAFFLLEGNFVGYTMCFSMFLRFRSKNSGHHQRSCRRLMASEFLDFYISEILVHELGPSSEKLWTFVSVRVL